MKLYEVIRWGNDSENPFTGGPDGADTCFLVRAASVEQAGELADAELRKLKPQRVAAFAGAAYLLGEEHSTDATPRVLRGPYEQHAHRHGWRHWYREEAGGGWVERMDTAQATAHAKAPSKLGALLVGIGGQAQLSDEELAKFDQMRDKKPAGGASFD